MHPPPPPLLPSQMNGHNHTLLLCRSHIFLHCNTAATSGVGQHCCIRTFNRPKMLQRALASVAEQTYANREAVVINDGGESVAAIVAEFEPKLDIIHLEYGADDKPGRCLAATKGIEASSGDYIAYLDDDDIHYPDHLEALMERAVETQALCLYTDANVGTETPTGVAGEYVISELRPGASEDFSRTGFYRGCYIHLSTFCHHRSVFEKHGGFDTELPVLEDLDLFFRYAQDHDFEHVPRYTAQYQIRTDDTNAVTAMRKEFQETREALCQKYLHSAVTDVMTYIEEGRGRLEALHGMIFALVDRVESLEARLQKIDRGGE